MRESRSPAAGEERGHRVPRIEARKKQRHRHTSRRQPVLFACSDDLDERLEDIMPAASMATSARHPCRRRVIMWRRRLVAKIFPRMASMVIVVVLPRGRDSDQANPDPAGRHGSGGDRRPHRSRLAGTHPAPVPSRRRVHRSRTRGTSTVLPEDACQYCRYPPISARLHNRTTRRCSTLACSQSIGVTNHSQLRDGLPVKSMRNFF